MIGDDLASKPLNKNHVHSVTRAVTSAARDAPRLSHETPTGFGSRRCLRVDHVAAKSDFGCVKRLDSKSCARTCSRFDARGGSNAAAMRTARACDRANEKNGDRSCTAHVDPLRRSHSCGQHVRGETAGQTWMSYTVPKLADVPAGRPRRVRGSRHFGSCAL